MSEYQYYEWQTIDRALTTAEQSAVSELSSHIAVSATSAWVEYHWSDFKHDPCKVLARYFDAFLYFANWGSLRLAFRFPKGLLDEKTLQPYLWDDSCNLEPAGDFLILDISRASEDGGDGFDGEPRLSTLAPLRNDILAGDHRALYLAWLLGATLNGFDDDLEPPVPPGLKRLSAPLTEFVRFFQLDPILVKAAASASEALSVVPALPLDALIARLPRPECDAFLRRLADGEPLLALKFRRRLQELSEPAEVAPAPPAQRTWAELRRAAEEMRRQDERRKSAQAEAQRIKALQDFAPHAERAWDDVLALIEQKQARRYDEAVALLLRLRDLAVFQDHLPKFQTRLSDLQARYVNRPAFQERLRAAKLGL